MKCRHCRFVLNHQCVYKTVMKINWNQHWLDVCQNELLSGWNKTKIYQQCRTSAVQILHCTHTVHIWCTVIEQHFAWKHFQQMSSNSGCNSIDMDFCTGRGSMYIPMSVAEWQKREQWSTGQGEGWRWIGDAWFDFIY